MHHFVITAAAITGNLGTQSMFMVLYQYYAERFPDSRFHLISYYPQFDRQFEKQFKNLKVLPGTPLRLLFFTTPLALLYRLFTLLNVPCKIYKLDCVLTAYIESSLIMDMGGITFSDGREKYLPFNIITILPAVLFKKTCVKMAQALGPFANPFNKLAAKRLLPRLTHIFARGEITFAHLRSLGLKNISLSADTTFLLDADPQRPMGIKFRIPKPGRKLVGISPSSVVFKKCRASGIDYVAVMAEFITQLSAQYPCDVLLIPHSMRFHTDKLKNNDLPVVRAIAGRIPDEAHVSVLSCGLTATGMRALIGSCDYFVGSRYHSMISALAEKVPLIVCGWGHKYFETLDQFDLRSCAMDYKELSASLLLSKFKRMLENQDRIHQALETKLSEVKHLSRVQFDLSSRFFN